MRFNHGVNPSGIRPELMMALIVAEGVYGLKGKELVITSLNDSRHSETSLHYAGCAADLRIRHMTRLIAERICERLRDWLGHNPDYDIVLEDDHIHLEYQPKRR